ncbi:hypothetical protein LT493_21565 [Streptomyces tricolor]|nr:hypothetical protein [Streptomyces tricolor]
MSSSRARSSSEARPADRPSTRLSAEQSRRPKSSSPVDHVDGAVRKLTQELLTLARRIGRRRRGLFGNGRRRHRRHARRARRGEGPHHDASEYAEYLVVPKVDALQAAYEAVSPAAVLVPSAEGKEIAARLALRIGSGIITDAVDLEAGDEGPVITQSVFAASFTTSRGSSRAPRSSRSSRTRPPWRPPGRGRGRGPVHDLLGPGDRHEDHRPYAA